jgi:hypothetical protein
MRLINITAQKEYKVGDPAPEGYLEWHEWAEVHRKAGIKQVECCHCGKWKMPNELHAKPFSFVAIDPRKGPIKVEKSQCKKCADKQSKKGK